MNVMQCEREEDGGLNGKTLNKNSSVSEAAICKSVTMCVKTM